MPELEIYLPSPPGIDDKAKRRKTLKPHKTDTDAHNAWTYITELLDNKTGYKVTLDDHWPYHLRFSHSIAYMHYPGDISGLF